MILEDKYLLQHFESCSKGQIYMVLTSDKTLKKKLKGLQVTGFYLA